MGAFVYVVASKVRSLACQIAVIVLSLLVKSTRGCFSGLTGRTQKQGRAEAVPVGKRGEVSALLLN
jgi:hypothetical protein